MFVAFVGVFVFVEVAWLVTSLVPLSTKVSIGVTVVVVVAGKIHSVARVHVS